MTDIHASHITLIIFQKGDRVGGLDTPPGFYYYPNARGTICTACHRMSAYLIDPCDPKCSECDSPRSEHAGESCLFGPTKYRQRVYDIKIERTWS